MSIIEKTANKYLGGYTYYCLLPLSLPLLGPLAFPFLVVTAVLFPLQTLVLVFLVAVIPAVKKKKKSYQLLYKHITLRNKKEIIFSI